jgi:SulP family sulfate permease
VIVRLRGQEGLGTTFIDVLSRYAQSLAHVDSKLVIASASHRARSQLAATGLTELIGTENVYRGRRRIGAAVQDAYADARAWIDAHPTDEPQ